MEKFITVLLEVFFFLLLGVPGFVLGKLNKIEKNSEASIVNILIYVAIPFLVFTKILETDLTSLGIIEVILCAILPLTLTPLTLLLGKLIFKTPLGYENAFCSAFPNCGMMGIPISVALFPSNPEVAVYVSLFNVFSTFALFVIGERFLSKDRGRGSILKGIFSPITIALLVGFICSFIKNEDFMIKLIDMTSVLSSLSAPLSVILLGFLLSKVKLVKYIKGAWLYLSVAVKLVLMPLLTVLILYFTKAIVNSFSLFAVYALVIATAMPTAITAPALLGKHGFDEDYATANLVIGTVLSIITIPLLYLLTYEFF